MKVKVKKSVLFNLLKRYMNENRTNDNPTGNFISPLNKDEDRFGFWDEDEETNVPISPSPHIPIISVEAPPVEDPDYVPASTQELASALNVISREVPINQIEYFYRKIHKLLDDSLDNNQEDMLSEGINLLNESETFSDKLIQSAINKIQSGEDREEVVYNLIQNYTEFEDFDPFDLLTMIEDKMIGGTQDQESNVIDDFGGASTQKTGSGTIPMKPDAPQPQHPIGADKKKQDSLRLDVPMAKEPILKKALHEDPVIDFIAQTHDLLFDISRRVEREYFESHFTEQGQEAQRMGLSLDRINQATKKYGITNDFVFTHLNLTKKKGGAYVFDSKKVQSEIEKFIRNYADLPEGSDYNNLLDSAASEMKLPRERAIPFLSRLLTKKYDQERDSYQDIPADEYLVGREGKIGEIEKLFSIVVKHPPYDFTQLSGDRSDFMNRASQDLVEPIIEDMLAKIQKRMSGENYIFKIGKHIHQYPVEHVKNEISTFVQVKIDGALAFQEEKRARKAQDKEDSKVGNAISDEDAAAAAFAKKIAKLSNTTNFDNLAPFFGFSSASGLRQWYLKHAMRKIKALGVGKDTGKSAFSKLYNQTLEAIIPYIVEAIELKINEFNGNPGLGEQDQQKLLIMKHALPQIKQIDDLMQDGRYLRPNEEGTVEGQDLLYSVGGYIMRTVNGEIYKPIMNLIDRQWTDFVAGLIQDKAQVDLKKAKSLAEYFTGKKEIPNYESMTKAAKNLLNAGIDFELFEVLISASNDWFDDTIETEFSKFNTAEDKFAGEFLQAALKTTEKLVKKPNEMKKYLDKAVNMYIEDLAHQIAFKNLSQYETISGD